MMMMSSLLLLSRKPLSLTGLRPITKRRHIVTHIICATHSETVSTRMCNIDSTMTTTSRRRKRTISALFLISLASLSWQGDAFGLRQITRRISRTLADSANNNNVDGSWSKPARSSPLQVRKRVKAVLDKARTRTGIDNASAMEGPNVVADAASIGGLGDSDVVIQVKKNKSFSLGLNSYPDEDLTVLQKSNGSSSPSRKPETFDVIRGDAPAANQFCEPLPFQLPKLSAEQKQLLAEGERIQEQSRMGREGSGYVVLDVKVPPYVVWECLLDFESYPDTIPTVREMQLYTSEKLSTGYVNEKPVLPGTGREARHYGTPSITRASFSLSKFKLNIAAIHKYTPHPDGDYMEFNLDRSCTNMVLKGAKGIWYTEENPDGREGYTRVYLLCEVQISRALPSFIVDYAAVRAMPRATTWLRPLVEAAGDLWLKEPNQ